MGTTSWQGIAKPVHHRAGTAATETFVAGTCITYIWAIGAGTIVMPKGDGANTVTVTTVAAAPFIYSARHLNNVMGGPGDPTAQLQIVFSGTSSYFIEYVIPGVGV